MARIFSPGKLYITTNEDAPHYRVFVADAANAEARKLEGNHPGVGRCAAERERYRRQTAGAV